MSEAIEEGLTSAGPRPVTAYYGDVTGVIETTYHPPDILSPDSGPKQAADMVEAVLSGDQLL